MDEAQCLVRLGEIGLQRKCELGIIVRIRDAPLVWSWR
jgi:hypothetical protein